MRMAGLFFHIYYMEKEAHNSAACDRAAIFLPLGLLTDLLRINVGGIPGTESKTASTIVTLLLIVIAFVEFWIFKRRKWV